jgi:HAD superfamily hydrolase (TIGR01484 family)
MRYHVLATDYDGTLAHDGRVDDDTVAALKRLANTGRKLVLVTGRELDDLLAAFPQAELFDRIVAENGALLHHPAGQTTTPLGDPRRRSSSRPCAAAASTRSRSAASSWRPGTPTRPPCSRRSASSAWSCR